MGDRSSLAGLGCAACSASFAPCRGRSRRRTTPRRASTSSAVESAFEQADYESALVYFRHAYRLSHRGELQYNIGVAADRLQREEEALEAFEHYLEENEDPAREAEVQERIIALRQSIAERDATERALEEATIRYQTAHERGASDGARFRRPRSSVRVRWPRLVLQVLPR